MRNPLLPFHFAKVDLAVGGREVQKFVANSVFIDQKQFFVCREVHPVACNCKHKKALSDVHHEV